MCGPAKQSRVTSYRTQRGLSHAVHLDDLGLKSQGQHSEEDLSTWKNCTSGKLTFHPFFWSTASPERDCPWKEVPMFVPDPYPTTSHPLP